MLHLKYKSTDNGSCRCYYTAPGKNPRQTLLYCLQEEWTKKQAEKYGYQQFVLYRCTRDGEPNYEIPLENISSINKATSNKSTAINLNEFLKLNIDKHRKGMI